MFDTVELSCDGIKKSHPRDKSFPFYSKFSQRNYVVTFNFNTNSKQSLQIPISSNNAIKD